MLAEPAHPTTKMKLMSGCCSLSRFINSYVLNARPSWISRSFTFIGKVLPKEEFTAKWHMIKRWIAGVFSDGLSGRGPHGTSHTSSALLRRSIRWNKCALPIPAVYRWCNISQALVRCALVIGSKEPPNIATVFLVFRRMYSCIRHKGLVVCRSVFTSVLQHTPFLVLWSQWYEYSVSIRRFHLGAWRSAFASVPVHPCW